MKKANKKAKPVMSTGDNVIVRMKHKGNSTQRAMANFLIIARQVEKSSGVSLLKLACWLNYNDMKRGTIEAAQGSLDESKRAKNKDDRRDCLEASRQSMEDSCQDGIELAAEDRDAARFLYELTRDVGQDFDPDFKKPVLRSNGSHAGPMRQSLDKPCLPDAPKSRKQAKRRK